MGDFIEVPKKLCSSCGHPKYVTLFSKDRSKPDGRRHVCKTCDSRRQNRRYQANRAAAAESQRERYRTDAAYRAAKITNVQERRVAVRASRDTSVRDRLPTDIGGVIHPRGVA